jgi:hypothetical protein
MMYYITRHANITTPRPEIIYRVWQGINRWDVQHLCFLRNQGNSLGHLQRNWTAIKRNVVFETNDLEELQTQMLLIEMGEDLWYIYSYHKGTDQY